MQFKSTLISLALVAAAAASPMFTSYPAAVVAGQPATWAYSGAAGPVTITLKTGDPKDLGTVMTLASGSTGTFTWQVPANIVDGSYALEIDDGTSPPNYSNLFAVTGGTTGTIATVATTGSVTAIATASASASASASESASASASSTDSTDSSSSKSSLSTRTRLTTETQTESSAPSATTAVGNLNAAGTLSASPFAFIITAILGLLVF